MYTYTYIHTHVGLRTLVIAKKCLTRTEWEAWDATHKAAATALNGRDEALMAAAEAIEQVLWCVAV